MSNIGQIYPSGFGIPVDIRDVAGPEDCFIGIDVSGHLYQITKAKLLAGLSSGGGVGGRIICNTGCEITGANSGKAFEFFSAQSDLILKVLPSYDISIQPTANAIVIYRWSQMPNTGMNGRESIPVATLSKLGGNITINLTSTYRWISIFARNPSKNNSLDGCCFVINGNTITLLAF